MCVAKTAHTLSGPLGQTPHRLLCVSVCCSVGNEMGLRRKLTKHVGTFFPNKLMPVIHVCVLHSTYDVATLLETGLRKLRCRIR